MNEIQLDLFGDENNGPEPAKHARELSWREKYNLVISSPRWKKLRVKLIEKAGGKCPRCGWKKEKWDKSRTLELHHKTYERLGNERNEDLEIVCSHCHTKADIERTIRNREQGQRKSRKALEDARFDGWASKVYGDDYDDSDGDKYDRYLDWAERRDR